MSNARRHARNATALLLSAVVGKGLFLVANLVIIKALSVPYNGLLQQSYIFGTTFMLLTDFGLRGWLVRELSRRRWRWRCRPCGPAVTMPSLRPSRLSSWCMG